MMKKFFVAIVMVLAAFACGLYFGDNPTVNQVKMMINREWDYKEGIDRIEVRADYDDEQFDEKEGVPRCYTEVLCWDEEYRTYKVVASGYYSKADLMDLAYKSHDMQELYLARIHF